MFSNDSGSWESDPRKLTENYQGLQHLGELIISVRLLVKIIDGLLWERREGKTTGQRWPISLDFSCGQSSTGEVGREQVVRLDEQSNYSEGKFMEKGNGSHNKWDSFADYRERSQTVPSEGSEEGQSPEQLEGISEIEITMSGFAGAQAAEVARKNMIEEVQRIARQNIKVGKSSNDAT